MNVYDFDKTITDVDSTASFVRYCAGRWPRVLLTLPGTGFAAIAMALRIIPKTRFKQYMFRFLRHVPDVEQAVTDFWNGDFCSIHSWYLAQHSEDDLVISASPEFLLRPICHKLGISQLICSQVDPDTGRYTGVNCDGHNKVLRYREQYGDLVPDAFYSDSRNDEPMARISRSAYIVRGETIEPWIFDNEEVSP